jgi:subtilisin family serine protease
MRYVVVGLALAACTETNGPVAGPQFETSNQLTDSTSARGLNSILLTRNAGVIRMPAKPTTRDGRPWHGRKYIVGFYGSGKDDRAADRNVLRSAGAVEQYYFYGFRATAAFLDSAAVDRLQKNPAVAWIDSSREAAVPFSETTSWAFTQHHFDQAQSAGYLGDAQVRVAIIGDGIQCSLADLQNKCGTGVDITGEGVNPNVDGGHTGVAHETRIASIIAAQVGNGIGIKGGAPYVSIHSVYATDPDSAALMTCEDMAQAIDFANSPWGLGADIINLSWGIFPGEGPGEAHADCRDLLSNTLQGVGAGNHTILVAAPGDSAGAPVAYPAALSQAVAVSALQFTFPGGITIWPHSTYGPEIDIAAGGSNIPALDETGAVSSRSGTSYAVPYVAAGFALLYAQKLSLLGCKPTAYEAKFALFNSTLWGRWMDPNLYGAGVLDVYAALTSDWLLGGSCGGPVDPQDPHEWP